MCLEKLRNVSKKLVEAAVYKAVSEYNFGVVAQISSMKGATVLPGRKSFHLSLQRDNRRKRRVKRKRSIEYQKRKRWLRLKNSNEEERKKDKEGVSYGAGQF